MLCSKCTQNEASVFFKQIANNQVTEVRLCLPCAQAQETAAAVSPVFDLLSALGGTAKFKTARPAPCSLCGLRWSDFKKSGRLGCPTCYESFAKPLADILKRIHGATAHCGKLPPDAPEKLRTKELSRLRDDLQRALTEESYETAARLRDRIKTLSGEEKECS
jgi:protein arginine kinase activator